ncbi:hypothetical protein HN018_23490 (plasmid) [Lichenicola cladoniae]|uniref:ABM domain-containing protein n=1 Tax=Lichenicola cladoniae TaxID=1484109 RepID=A0A6M8HXT6_9PROT|nr:antibiotic biosynthesis monooxygenase [Lichenicola cladoniae]NPD66316.1 hypothetical protein [Acetobacteraceae bacterium]QKE93150.1 hypothetical protein HN018_23490 [Lichenicola cladoniae]
MTPSVTFTVQLTLKPDEVERFCDSLLPELLQQTRGFEGVRSARAVRMDDGSNRVLFIDEFDSIEANQRYLAWREERGELTMLRSLLTQPPIMDLWPLTIKTV